eukprot:scaffold251_cov88-Cylindrotheca_fusiformis.AAC.4
MVASFRHVASDELWCNSNVQLKCREVRDFKLTSSWLCSKGGVIGESIPSQANSPRIWSSPHR